MGDMALVTSYLEEFNELAAAFDSSNNDDAVLRRLEDCVKQSDLLSRTNRDQPELVAAVNGMKNRLAVMKKASLTGGGKGAQRQQLQQQMDSTQEKVEHQNKMIKNAHQTATEAEETGHQILGELARNKEKIASVQDRTREFAGEVNSAEGLLKSMSARDRCVIS